MIGLSEHSFTAVAYGPAKKFFDALPKNYYNKLLTVFEGIKTDISVSPEFTKNKHKHYSNILYNGLTLIIFV